MNLFRQGVQLTPGLNMAQKEFRDAIMGAAGEQAQAQAVGQMGMGALLMGTFGTLAYQGLITGDAPSDTKLAAEAMQDGWRPNSIVIPHADGTKTYIPFDRYDPVMMPMAMAANIVSVLKSPELADQKKGLPMLEALSVALIKQLTDKLYLQSLKQTIEAVQDPDRSFAKWAGSMAGNYMPFSSLAHAINTDPIMREADGFISAALGKYPGFSGEFPARRDWAGDPITVHKGLWLSTPADKANAEIERLALQQGGSIGAPSARTKGETDLRGITLAGNADPAAKGRNAYDRFQEIAGHPDQFPGNEGAPSLRKTVTELIGSDAYQNAPDGAAQTRGTKSAMVTHVIAQYRNGALRQMAADSNVQKEEYAEQMRVAKAYGAKDPGQPHANQPGGQLPAIPWASLRAVRRSADPEPCGADHGAPRTCPAVIASKKRRRRSRYLQGSGSLIGTMARDHDAHTITADRRSR